MTGPRIPEQDLPNIKSKAVADQAADLRVVRDIAAGSRRLRERSTEYLPQHPAEEAKNYQIRLKRPTFFNAFRKTIEGLVGMVFRVNPQLGEDVPAVIQQHWENIDKEGTHGDVFCRQLLDDGLEAGHAAILVDYPALQNPKGVTLYDERKQDIRPYWVHIHKEDIINFRTIRGPSGERILQQVTLRFTTHEAHGRFGDRVVVRYRVYRLVPVDGAVTVQWETWEEDESGTPRVSGPSGTIAKLERIPLVPVYGKADGYLTSTPPLLDLAYRNLLHYQTNSDYFEGLYMGLVPVAVFTGIEAGQAAIGPHSAVYLPTGASFGYEETSGNSFGAARQALEDLKGEMAVLGLALLQADTRAAETAASKRLDKAEKDSALSVAARGLQDAIEAALAFHAQYLGLADGGSVKVNRDFLGEPLDGPTITALSTVVAKGQLSLETMWAKLADNQWLPEDFDAEVEKQRLKDEGSLPVAGQPPAPDGTQPPQLQVVAQGNPYRVVTDGAQFCVVKSDTGERLKCYPTKEAAMAYFKALEANVPDAHA